MSRVDIEKEYINGVFRNRCPFCLTRHANWKWEYSFFRRIRFLCSECNAEISFKCSDVEQNERKYATIIVENANGHHVLKQYEGRKVSLLEFMNTTILPHQYRAVRYIEGKGFPDSCKTCDFGKNTDRDTTICNKFWIESAPNHICNQYSDSKFRRAINAFIR